MQVIIVRRYMNRKLRNRLRQLETEREELLELLSRFPSDSALARRLNEVDIKIVIITLEQTIDY